MNEIVISLFIALLFSESLVKIFYLLNYQGQRQQLDMRFPERSDVLNRVMTYSNAA